MKTINYTGTSKLISRIVHLLNRKAPLPLDGQGDAEWGTSGQVLTTDGQGNTYWGEGGGGGGGDVTDVEVNGTSVVNAQGVAEVSVPTATSDLNNDSGFITNLVNDLANYYTKSQTYTQAEVDALISGIVTLNILVVQTLPTQDISTTTIYLVPKQDTGTSDIYDEYLYINNAWELIGTTQIDLSNYVTTTDLSTALADYVTSVGLATILAGYVQSSDLGDGTLTIQQNGTTLGTFTANQSGNTTVNLTGGGSTYTEGDGIDISNNEISVDTTFTEASARANIASGDSFSTILGKIKKFFSDLKTVAFTGAYSDLSGQPTIPTNTNQLTNGAGFITSSGSCASATKATQDGSGNTITSTYVKKSGDTMTGDLVLTGTTYLAGEAPNGSTTNHALLMGHAGQDYWRFYEYGGVFTFYKSQYGTNTKLGEINANGWEGNVKGDVTGNASTATKATQDGDGSTISSTYLKLAGGTMTGKLCFGSVSTSYGDKLEIRTNSSGTFWPLALKNTYNANETGYGPGIKLANGGDTETSKWAGIRAEASSGYSNRTDLVLYASAAERARISNDGIIMNGTTQVQFGDNTIFVAKDSSSWLHIKSNNGNVYRSAYHDFKNANNTAYVGISVGGATMFSGSTSASTWSCDANEVALSENRGNGLCIRAESGLWVRPRGTSGSSFKPVAASAFNVNSSIRYKENIQPLSEEEARKILEVEAVTYDYKDKENSDDRSVLNQRGVIAEQVEEIIPSVVTLEKVDGEDVPGYVDYSKFVPYLIKMVQIQQKEIDELKAIVKATITETEEE